MMPMSSLNSAFFSTVKILKKWTASDTSRVLDKVTALSTWRVLKKWTESDTSRMLDMPTAPIMPMSSLNSALWSTVKVSYKWVALDTSRVLENPTASLTPNMPRTVMLPEVVKLLLMSKSLLNMKPLGFSVSSAWYPSTSKVLKLPNTEVLLESAGLMLK